MSKLFIIGSLSNMDYIKKLGEWYNRQGYEVATIHNQPFKTFAGIILDTYHNIEEADAVIAVTKKDGSFGDGTTYEIAFAEYIGKTVRVLNHREIDKMIKPTLNEYERKFIELLNPDHYIARDDDGILYIHNHEPEKGHHRWVDCSVDNFSVTPFDFLHSSIKFNFITWDDEKPWKVEDLSKLDVA